MLSLPSVELNSIMCPAGFKSGLSTSREIPQMRCCRKRFLSTPQSHRHVRHTFLIPEFYMQEAINKGRAVVLVGSDDGGVAVAGWKPKLHYAQSSFVMLENKHGMKRNVQSILKHESIGKGLN